MAILPEESLARRWSGSHLPLVSLHKLTRTPHCQDKALQSRGHASLLLPYVPRGWPVFPFTNPTHCSPAS